MGFVLLEIVWTGAYGHESICLYLGLHFTKREMDVSDVYHFLHVSNVFICLCIIFAMLPISFLLSLIYLVNGMVFTFLCPPF